MLGRYWVKYGLPTRSACSDRHLRMPMFGVVIKQTAFADILGFKHIFFCFALTFHLVFFHLEVDNDDTLVKRVAHTSDVRPQIVAK